MRILLADSHDQVRSALRLLLEQERAIEVVGEAYEEEGLLETIGRCPADLLLLDWGLLGSRPEVTLSAVRLRRPHLAIIVLSSRPEARQAATDAGVEYFVSKSSFAEELLATLRHVSRLQSLSRGAARNRVEFKPHGI